MSIFVIAILALAVLFIVLNVRVVPQAHACIIERLGAYSTTWRTGVHIKMPFIDRVAKKISLKEDLMDFLPQPVITKDNVTIEIDSVVYFQVTDPKLYTYGIENPMNAVENLTATTLRNVVGELDLDDTLTSRDTINAKMRAVLDEATDQWGIKIHRVELKGITPPHDIAEAMEKQMRAEREKREAVLRAEGEKQAQILKAQGEKEARVLEAEADKLAQIARAEGESEAIRMTQKAVATGLQYLNQAKADPATLKLKGYEALMALAEGQSNTIVVPSDLQNVAGITSTVAGIAKKQG